jgi:hypothetical protein
MQRRKEAQLIKSLVFFAPLRLCAEKKNDEH